MESSFDGSRLAIQADRWRSTKFKSKKPYDDYEDDEDIVLDAKKLFGHKEEIQAICFSPDSCLLATSSADMTIRVWDAGTGAEKHVLSGHAKGDGWLSQIDALAFSPKGDTLVSGGAEGALRVWDPQSGKCLKELREHQAWIKALAFSPDGRYLASVSLNEGVVLLDASTWEKVAAFSGHKGEIQCVAFSPSGSFLASGGLHDSTVHIWNTKEAKLHTVVRHQNSIHSVCFGSDDSILASASDDHTAKLWDVSTGKSIRTISEHQWGARKVAYSPNGSILVCGGADPAFRVFNLDTKSVYVLGEGRTGLLISIHPSNKYMILGESDYPSIQLVDINNGKIISYPGVDDKYVSSLSLSPNGKFVAAGHKGGNTYLWDLEAIHLEESGSE